MMGTFNSGGARLEQLNRWLQTVLDERSPQLSPASADASFRRYFRVLPSDETSGETYICMDAPVAQEDTRPFITVAAMLGAAGIEVPTVLEANVEEGFLLLRDLGSQTYLDALSAGEAPGPLYEDAIVALATMHGAVDAAALPPYDAEYLQYEMGMFDEWFTSKLLGLELDNRQTVLLAQTRDALVAEALTSPQGFVHRDYHSRNLMVSEPVRPGVLDFQDAMHGPMVYDLVSLLRDSYVRWPAAAIDEWIALYRELAESRGVPVGSPAEFRRRFDLVGAQRHLKVCGIFARLYLRDGKASYLQDIPLTLEHLQAALRPYGEFSNFSLFLRNTVAPAMTEALQRVADQRADDEDGETTSHEVPAP